MSTPAYSLAYRFAKMRLSRRPSKASIAIFLGFSLLWFAWAIWDSHGRTMNLILGLTFLQAAYSEWEMLGVHEVIEEQRRPGACA